MKADSRILAKVATLYYLEGLNQREVGDRLNVSVATVSRLVSRAREEGIVEILVHAPDDSRQELELEIEKRFAIRECAVFRSSEHPERRVRVAGTVFSSVVERVVRYGSCVGIGWGETLRAVTDHLAVAQPLRAKMVPVAGTSGGSENAFATNSIVRDMAERLGSESYLTNFPAVLDSYETREMLEGDSNIRGVRRLWDKLETLAVGVSGLSPGASLHRHRILSRRDVEHLAELGVVSVLNVWFLDADGRLVETDVDARIIRPSFESVKRVPNRILVAYGREKREPVRAAVLSGAVNVLLVDEAVAEGLVS